MEERPRNYGSATFPAAASFGGKGDRVLNEAALVTLPVALAFALVHVFGNRMRFLQATPRSIWLSFAGGISLSYVFVHLLPELAARQEEAIKQAGAGENGLFSLYAYVAALVGLVVFYGLDRLVRWARPGAPEENRAPPVELFWVHVGSYAVYTVLIGYLLVHREDPDPRGLTIYAVALGFHFIVNDQGLREYHGKAYDRGARWILAAAPLIGWAIGISVSISEVALLTVFAFLAGSIVLNVLKEELPEERESRFWALVAGATLFTALLLLAGGGPAP